LFLQADITKFHRAVGWVPSITLEEGLNHTIQWYQAREQKVR
jgi:nucleoside-diphosphate-sugar epimerase